MSYMNRGFASLSHNINGRRPLTNDELFGLAPSIFATESHESRSERFAFVPSFEIVEGMRQSGFLPFFARQGRSRVPGKAEFTRHIVRFRQEGQVEQAKRIGGIYSEVVMVNAHDGTSQVDLMEGLLRLVCLNGNVVSHGDGTTLKIPHRGDVVDRVIDASFEVISNSRLAIEQASSWSEITLNRDEQLAMATAAHSVRFADTEGNVDTAIQPEQLLHLRRREDEGNDLWRVGQRIQEAVIRGGLTGRARGADGRTRTSTSRPITGISEDIRINRALWTLNETMARLKQAA